LARLARDTGTSVAEAAALLLGDLIPGPALLLAPVAGDDGGETTDFTIERSTGVPQTLQHPSGGSLIAGARLPAVCPAIRQSGLYDPLDAPLILRAVVQDATAGRRTAELELAATRTKIEVERREATLRMQEAILPAPEHQFRYGRFDIAVRYQPAQSGNRVGGDWYEARAEDDGTVLVTIGDVAGHGLTAAAGMARIGNALRGMTVTRQPPDTLLRWLNDLMCTDEIPERIASAAVGVLDANPPRLRWAQAGHPPPVLVRGGEPRPLARPAGLLLGTMRGADYELATEDLAPGDLVIFYTDGLIERRGHDIDEGLTELLKAAACCQDATAAAAAEELAADLSPGDDDMCVLVVQVR
jgi:serine phosphatase RsbU (regulator of sigma subunit)